MKSTTVTLLCLIFTLSSQAQFFFSDASFLFQFSGVSSGAPIGVADMNNDGLDDVIRLDEASDLIIEYQQADGGQFVADNYGNAGPGREWGMAIADIENNGYLDIVVGGAYNHLKVFRTNAEGVDSVYWLPEPGNVFLQAVNFADIDNDGLIDIFACDDDDISKPFQNLGNHDWLMDVDLINTASPTPSDNSGNYGSVWTDYDSDGDIDLYISKCRLGVEEPLDGRRTNLLFENDGNNNYTEVALERGLRPYGQSWVTDFGDLDNDGDMDALIVNHDITSMIYENQGDTLWVDRTNTSGMATDLGSWPGGIQCVFDDFDNDGFNDILLTGISGHLVYHNNGDFTFSAVNAFPNSIPGMHTLGVGDLNNDGFLDVLGGFGSGYNSPSNNPDKIFVNDGNENNWIKVALDGRTSNRKGVGARLELYGTWGMQVREIRAGEGYGIVTSLEAHFGIGEAVSIDSLVINWPSGIRDVICSLDTNTAIVVKESCRPLCSSGRFTAAATICAGEFYDFNGLDIGVSGVYEGTYTASGGCDSMVTLTLTVDSIDTDIEQDGFILEASTGIDYTYQWVDCGNGGALIPDETGSTFTATADGFYGVLISNLNCSVTSSCVEVVGTANYDAVLDGLIEIYPNPLTDRLRMDFPSGEDAFEVRIYSMYGALMIETSSREKRLELETDDWPAGTYLLEIRRGDAFISRQLVKP